MLLIDNTEVATGSSRKKPAGSRIENDEWFQILYPAPADSLFAKYDEIGVRVVTTGFASSYYQCARCKNGADALCDHLLDVYAFNLDGDFLVGCGERMWRVYCGGRMLLVDFGVFEHAESTYQAEVLIPPGKTGRAEDMEFPLGLISPGDGIGSISKRAYKMFKHLATLEDAPSYFGSCRNEIHGKPSWKRETARMPKITEFSNLWSALHTGSCLHCVTIERSLQELVPGVF